MINMKKKDLENITKAMSILNEERFSDTVKEMLKAVPISAQGGSKIEHKKLREDAVIAFEENTITAAFTNYIKANPKDTFSGFIITFDKKKQGSGEMKKIQTKKAFTQKNRAYSLQYTMSITEMMTLTETQKPKIAIGMAVDVFKIIEEQWKKLNYTIQGSKTTKLTMVHSAAQNAPPPPPPPTTTAPTTTPTTIPTTIPLPP